MESYKQEVRMRQIEMNHRIRSISNQKTLRFLTPFTIFIRQLYSNDLVMYEVKGLENGEYLFGVCNGKEFDNLSIWDVQDIAETAHILDELERDNFKYGKDDYVILVPVKYSVIHEGGHVDIMEDDKPIVSWNSDEWEEDPETVVPAVIQGIILAYTNPIRLKEILSGIRPQK